MTEHEVENEVAGLALEEARRSHAFFASGVEGFRRRLQALGAFGAGLLGVLAREALVTDSAHMHTRCFVVAVVVSIVFTVHMLRVLRPSDLIITVPGVEGIANLTQSVTTVSRARLKVAISIEESVTEGIAELKSLEGRAGWLVYWFALALVLWMRMLWLS